MKKIPGLGRTEVRIFLVTFFLSLIVFFVMFAVGLPLIFEQRLLSSRFSSWYVTNFFLGMFLYFFAVGVLSVLVFIFVKNMNVEGRTFIISLFTVFLGTLGGVSTVSLYYGNHVDPFWVITWWTGLGQGKTGYMLFFFTVFLLLVSAFISSVLIISYKAYRIVRMRREKHNR